MKLLGNHLTLCTGFSLLVGFLTEQRRISACFNGVFALMFCESISKIFNFSRTAEKKKKTTMRSDNAAVSGWIADRSNFMSDCPNLH